MKIEVSVIIVNYNGLKYLQNCLDSLYENLKNIRFEIIVVDNNSDDESCSFIKTHFPAVKLLESNENLGFGKANNYGVQHAKGDFILFLNNDTILLDPVQPALEVLKSNQDYGFLTINMVGENKNYIPAVGKFPSPWRMIKISLLNDGRTEFRTGNFNKEKTYQVDWVTGAFMLLRKADFEKVGGFDPDYFMYVEDVDLCKKIADLGKTGAFVPKLSYIHFVGFNKSRENMLIQGYRIFAQKHFPGPSKQLALMLLFVNKTVKRLKNY